MILLAIPTDIVMQLDYAVVMKDLMLPQIAALVVQIITTTPLVYVRTKYYY
jgi:hypothetical protein